METTQFAFRHGSGGFVWDGFAAVAIRTDTVDRPGAGFRADGAFELDLWICGFGVARRNFAQRGFHPFKLVRRNKPLGAGVFLLCNSSRAANGVAAAFGLSLADDRASRLHTNVDLRIIIEAAFHSGSSYRDSIARFSG